MRHNPWPELERRLGALAKADASKLGTLLAEYLAESIHGDFEGFDSRDRAPIARFLTDFALYVESAD